MRRLLIPVFAIFPYIFCNAQVTTAVRDGDIGIVRKYFNDTLSVEKVARNSVAYKGGLLKNDIILSIDSVKVTGVHMPSWETAMHFHGMKGTEVRLQLYRPRGDSTFEVTLVRDGRIPLSSSCFYEFLADTADVWGINDILSDSVNRLFADPRKLKVTIYSVKKGSHAEKLGLLPGDELTSIATLLDNSNSEFNMFWGGMFFDLFRQKIKDTILTVQRNDSVLKISIDPGEDPLEGAHSVFYMVGQRADVWLKIKLDPMISGTGEYAFNFYFENKVQWFNIYNPDSIVEKKCGYGYSKEEQDYFINGEYYIRLLLERDKPVTCYVKLSREPDHDIFPMVTYSPLNAILAKDRLARSFLAFFIGAILIMILYNLTFFLSLREISYLYYIFFILFLTATLASDAGLQFRILENVMSRDNIYFLTDIVGILTLLSYMLFSMEYLKLKEIKRFWHAAMRILFAVLCILFIVYAALDVLFEIYAEFLFYLIVAGGFLGFAGLTIAAVLRIRKGYIDGWWFLIAHLILIVLIVYYDQSAWLSQYILYKSNIGQILLFNSIQLGILATIVLFTIALGRRMRSSEIEKRKAQEAMIVQLQENEKLKDKVNRELEQKVTERTREIMDQKDEIEAQRDEIEAQRDEIEAQRDQLEVQRDVVMKQNEETTASINSARKIQQAVLPSESILKKAMPEYFVLYKPRDIVSGDFYWIREIRNYLVVVAADCTGHGIPGAFMSMLGVTLLNELVGKSRLDKPGEILGKLRQKVKATLAQGGKAEEQKDGMDMALAMINKENMDLQFAGAYNPVYLVRKKSKEKKDELELFRAVNNEIYQLYEIKGDRQPIGIYPEETEFTTRKIRLQEKDALYLFSDGFADQFGGPDRRKFMSRKFKHTLVNVQGSSMEEQKSILEETLEKWTGNFNQVDDILVMGIRI